MKFYATKIISVVLVILSLMLTNDTADFYYNITHIDGAGTGLYLLLGSIEINDRIPYSNAYDYLIPLVLFTTFMWVIPIIMLIIAFRGKKTKVMA